MLYSLAALITGENFVKKKRNKNSKTQWKNEVFFKNFNPQESELAKNKLGKNIQISKFGFEYVAKNIQGWSEIFCFHI
jgi:hypothetical protein